MYTNNEYKIYVIVNNKYEPAVILNASCHLIAGLVYQIQDKIPFHVYQNKDGKVAANISHYPIVVLKAKNNNQLLNVIHASVENSINYNFFTDTMISSSAEEQISQTYQTSIDDIEFIGVAIFGETKLLNQFTKKYKAFIFQSEFANQIKFSEFSLHIINSIINICNTFENFMFFECGPAHIVTKMGKCGPALVC